MKWQKALNQFGLTYETVSIGLRNKINDYNQMVEGIDELKDSIKNPSINDNVDELKSDLADLQNSLENYDTQIVRAIEVYHKNKDRYAELAKNLGKGRPRKDGKTAQVKKVEPTQTQTTTETTTPAPVQVASQGTEVVEAVEEPKEKKKTNWWLFGGIIVLSAITLGLYRAKD
jgi:chromosome segregation ATPase